MATDAYQVARWSADLDVLARDLPAVHAHPFHTLAREEFDERVAGIRSRLPGLARYQVVVELMRLAAAIGDGHTTIAPWRDPVGFHTLPVSLYRFADGYHVRGATHAHVELVGARVTHVGGVPIGVAEQQVAALIGRDNDMGVLMHAPALLVMPEVLHATGLSGDPHSAELTVEVDGSPHPASLRAAESFPALSVGADWWRPRDGWRDLRNGTVAPLWLSRLTEPYWFCYLSEDALLYCQLNEVREHGDGLAAFFARALAAADSFRARRFVLDLRHNGGGNGDLNPAIVRALVRSRFGDPGNLFVITGRRTFSAAHMLVCLLETWTSPVFVGEPSSSRDNHYGDSAKLELPGLGLTVRVSTLYWQRDPRSTGPSMTVDVPAPLTVDAYRRGHDPALAAIRAAGQ